ncbi:ATP-dependent zinc metalloprotease FtsH [Flavobacterium celericrescens]|uniref:ATP-dependent zinc metalloprotease FtsH n=1 Tax=Flavobacterium celericrescens TaxID=2709780 RepID=A0ABX0IDK7_9FLAO|nr:ATP-dependent zinc metalloprotease FtsH [Flavobacterium celericrescens]NHM03777.1 ATP-dependent zinc metalloprotease FtsH [Flavobacterium celericrescens]
MAQNPNNNSGFKFSPWMSIVLVLMIFFTISLVTDGLDLSNPGKTSLSKFNKFLEAGQVEKVTFNNTKATIYLKKAALKDKAHAKVKNDITGKLNVKGPHYIMEIGDVKAFQDSLSKADASGKISEYEKEAESMWGDIISLLLPVILLGALWIFMMRRMSGGSGGGGGQIFSIGKSKAKLFDEKNDTRVTFENVAGLEGAKEEIQEIVEFLKNPEKYTSIGGKIPKGALLVGPPGTGKTLLAKAVAGEAKVPFFSLSGSDFVEMFVGVGASRVRDLFKQAKEKSPAIIFIDEIDAVGRARGKNNMTGANDERENTLNQLLTEMDGFGTNSNVIVLAATNRADVLDKALLRAGRFDRQIYVDLPDIRERKEIFEVHLKPLKKSEELDTEFLAKQTPGFSGADIANVCNEAALIAARNDKKAVDKQDFLDAVDRIVGGLEKKNKIVTPEEKRAIAIHEAGHATVSWMLEHAAPLVKVTIVPRGQSLGAAWYLPEERLIVRPEQMLDEMCATMGGRAAERVIFDKISTGALSDLEKVTRQARAMVTIYGLNEKLGNITYYDSSGQSDYNFSKPYSEDTAKVIDTEISKLIEEQYQRAIDILEHNKEKLTQLADILIEKEVIFKDDLETIFGKRPFDKQDESPVAE